MPIPMIPDLLKSGDKQLGLPRKDVYHKLVGQIGTALPNEEQYYAFRAVGRRRRDDLDGERRKGKSLFKDATLIERAQSN